MWSALIGFIGAIIGGLFSVWGSKIATKESIESQKAMFQEQRLNTKEKEHQEIISNAKIIFIDCMTALMESIRIVKGDNKKYIGTAANLPPINVNYSKLISSLSDYLSFKEMRELNKVYGIIEKIRHEIIKVDYILDDYKSISFSYNILLVEILGDRYEYIIKSHGLEFITDDFVLESMGLPYKTTFQKIKSIFE